MKAPVLVFQTKAERAEAKRSTAINRPLSEISCHDCGKMGCLIPVPHKKPEVPASAINWMGD